MCAAVQLLVVGELERFCTFIFHVTFKAGLGTPFHWLFYNVEIPQRYRDRISSTLNCDPIKLDAIHVSPMRKPDYFWSNIPNLEQVLTPLPILDRLNLQVKRLQIFMFLELFDLHLLFN